MKLDGKEISAEILQKLKTKIIKLKEKGITPTMAIVLMGDDQASAIYVKQKGIKAEEIGAVVKVYPVKKTTTKGVLEKLVKKLDADPKIHGIILQRPFPSKINVDELTELVSSIKEVDGFGLSSKYPVPVAESVILLLKKVHSKQSKLDFLQWLKSESIVVIGKGQTAGRPIIDLLLEKGASPTIIDSHTKNREALLKKADIIISAVGKRILSADFIKKGTILIGVGLYSDQDGKLKGDYDDLDVAGKASSYSPTPGGVGPVNVACLMQNLVRSAEISSN